MLLQKRFELSTKYFLCVIPFLLLNLSAIASDVVSGDKEYFETKSGQYSYIYPEEYRKLLTPLLELQAQIEKEYQASFKWSLDEEMALVLASDQNQIANGFASNFPSLRTVFYGGGAGFLDYFATSSWLRTLYIHEAAHLYQLNPKRELGKFAYNLLGNHPFTLLPVPFYTTTFTMLPLPVVPMPNVALPSWILEGNAVMNESRLGVGGRLYSGEFRSSFYSLLKSGKTNISTVTNNNLDYPFQEENYMVGAYLSLYMTNKYGVDKTNQFFFEHAKHYLNPFLVSNTMKSKFGKSYKEIVNEGLASYKKKALKQKDLKGKLIAKSVRRSELNFVNGKIVFLTSDDERYFKALTIFNSKTGKVTKKYGDYISGKVFYKNGKWVTAGSHTLAHNQFSFGLWEEGGKIVEGTQNHLVLDIKKNKTLYVDMKSNFGEAKLMINGKPAGVANSRAILDKNNHALYFRQNNNKRELVRNNKVILSFKGFYGKVVGVGKGDSVYFIASTKYGSTLFEYSKGRSYRISRADNITDAYVFSKSVLAQATTGEGVEYRLFKPTFKKRENPYMYRYKFEKDRSYKLLSKKVRSYKKSIKSSKLKESNYNSITNMRYDSMSFLYTDTEDDGSKSSFSANFSDPVGFNSLSYTYTDDESDAETEHLIAYRNSRHRLNYGLGLHYEKEDFKASTGNFSHKTTTPFILLGFSLWKEERSSLKTDWTLGLEKFNGGTNSVFYGNLTYGFSASASASFLPLRAFKSKLEVLREREGHTYAWANHFSYGLISETFLLGSLVASATDSGELELGEGVQDESYLTYSDLTAYTSRSNLLKSAKVGVGVKQVLDAHLLSWYFPIGLRRLVPGFVFNHVKYGLDLERSYNDYGFTLDFELLLNHQLPFTFGVEVLEKDFGLKSRSAAFKLNHRF